MTYNTGNPIGSADARDLYDNAQALDRAMNSSDPTWTDRLGVARPTFKGVESELNQKVAAAAASADEAAAIADSIDDRYLGAKASDPLTDNDGNPLQIGAEYYNTTTGYKLTYGNSGWYTPNVDGQALGQSGAGQGAEMVGFDSGTVASALNFAKRVQLLQSPDISDTIIFKKKALGATKVHYEPNGWVENGTAAKLDLMFEPLSTVQAEIGDLNSYRILNAWTATESSRGANGFAAINVKGRGHQFGIWPELLFGFQDVQLTGVPMKMYFFDTSDTAWRTPMIGMWRQGRTVTAAGVHTLANNKLYVSDGPGTTGSTRPSHTSGSVSDGGVSWTFIRDFSESSGSIKPLVIFGDREDMPKFGFPNAREQQAKQRVIWNGAKLTFLDAAGAAVAEIYTRTSDGKLVISNPDGSKYVVFDFGSASGDITFSGCRIAPRIKTMTGTETTVDMAGFDVLRLAQSAPTTITSIVGDAYQEFTVLAANGNTTLQHGAALLLSTGANLTMAANTALRFIVNGTKTASIEVGR